MSDKPFVYMFIVASVDGRISFGPNRTMWQDMDDSHKYIGAKGEKVHREVLELLRQRHHPTADILGSNSVVTKDEPLKDLPPAPGEIAPLLEDFLPEDVCRNPNLRGWLVVVDGQGRLRSGYRGDEDSGQYMIHLVSRSVPAEYLFFLRQQNIPYLVCGQQQVDLVQAMEKLRHKLAVSSAVTTAGGRLGGALLSQGLLDEIHIVVHPNVVGGLSVPSLFDCPHGQQPIPLKLIDAQKLAADHLWLVYKPVSSD